MEEIDTISDVMAMSGSAYLCCVIGKPFRSTDMYSRISNCAQYGPVEVIYLSLSMAFILNISFFLLGWLQSLYWLLHS